MLTKKNKKRFIANYCLNFTEPITKKYTILNIFFESIFYFFEVFCILKVQVLVDLVNLITLYAVH